MAEFEINCPHCGEKLTIQERWIGMEGKCPSCKKTFTIDLPTDKLPGPGKKSSGNCNLVIDNYEPEKKWKVIFAIWKLKNTELSEILDLMGHLPATIFENVSVEQAKETKRKLERIGAYVHLEDGKSSARQAEKKKRVFSRSSEKQQIRHNNPKAQARPSQSPESTGKSSDGFEDIIGGMCLGAFLAVCIFFVESSNGSSLPPLLYWIIIPVFWFIYIACGGLKLKSFSKNLIGVTIAFIITSILLNPESAIRSLLNSISFESSNTTVASADKSSVSTPTKGKSENGISKFTIKNKIFPKPEKCDVLIFPMSKKDEVKEWYSKIKNIYPEYCYYIRKKNKAEMETDAIKRMHLISDYSGHLHNIKFDTIDAQLAIKAAESECIAKNISFCNKVKENGAFSELLYDFEIEEFEKVVPKYKEPIVLFAYASVRYGDLTILRAWYLEYSPGKAVTWTLD